MPSVNITQQLYDYLNHHLVDGSIDATIRILIKQDDAHAGIPMSSVNNQPGQSVPQDDMDVGGRGDSTNSGYIR